MTVNNSFLSQDQLQSRSKQSDQNALAPVFYLKPSADVFKQRSQRFNLLAEKHQWQSYLLLLAQLSQAQHLALQQQLSHNLPNNLNPADWSATTYDCILPIYLQLVDYLRANSTGSVPAEILTKLLQVDDSKLVTIARQYRQQPVLSDQPQDYWIQLLTLASVQVLLSHQALLSQQQYHQQQQSDCCPCCQMSASASIVKTGTDNGLRYLCCQWCNSQWNAVRVRCTFCGNTKHISLQRVKQEVELAPFKAARAEACDHCHSYRKLFLLTQDSNAEPIADDIASLALDVLMAQENYQRGGDNIFIPA